MTNKQVLLMIAAFVTITLGSFIWYIATWDADARTELIPTNAPLFILADGLRPFPAETIPRIVSGTPLTLPPEAPVLTKGILL